MISMCFVLNFQFCVVSFSWTKTFLIVFNRCRWSQCGKQFGKFSHDSSFTDFEPFFLFCALFQCVIWSFWIIVTQWFESLWHNDLSTELHILGRNWHILWKEGWFSPAEWELRFSGPPDFSLNAPNVEAVKATRLNDKLMQDTKG